MKKLALLTMIISLALSTVSFAGLQREIWWDTNVGTIEEAWAVVNGETPAGLVDVIGDSGFGDQGVDYYVASISGYLIAPVDGDYVFYCASDDNSELLLDGVSVASVSGWAGDQDWFNANCTPSGPITLAAGQLVAIDSAMNEGTGGDNFSIGWKLPGSDVVTRIPDADTVPNEAALALARGLAPADGTTGVTSGMLSWLAPVNGAAAYDVLLGTDPAALDTLVAGQAETSADAGAVGAELAYSTTYYWQVVADGAAGAVVSFTTTDPVIINSATGDAQPLGAAAQLAVDAVSPVGAELTYQWHRLNFELIPGMVLPDVEIPGAESATLDIDPVTVADQGEYYCVITSPDGPVNSPVVFMDAQTGLIHQYTFDGSAADVVGGADGILVNTTGLSAFADGQLTLGNDGSQSSNGAGNNLSNGDYVDLPNGLVSSLTQMTIEIWSTWNLQTQGWARIYDIGTSNLGEDVSPGAGDPGVHSFYLCPKSSGNDADGNTIIEYRLGGSAPAITPGGRSPAGVETMYAHTHDDKAGLVKLYVNGFAVGGFDTLYPLKNMDDNNVWLGRSQWGDPMYVGSYNEMRIYDTVLSAEQIAADYLAGPDAMGVIPDDAEGFALVGDLNGDGVYDFLDAAIAADDFLTDSLNKSKQIAELQD